MKTAEEYLKQLVDEHPYKQPGNPDSYSKYNEGWSDALDCAEQVMEGVLSELKVDGKSYSWRPLEWTLSSLTKAIFSSDTVFGVYGVHWYDNAFEAHTPDLRVLGRYPTPDEAKKACEDDYRKSVIDEFFNEEKTAG